MSLYILQLFRGTLGATENEHRNTAKKIGKYRHHVNKNSENNATEAVYRCSILEILLGHVVERPGDSCKHILESGSSTSDGEYWIDPGLSGSPLKVYCDMTTDGGKLTYCV